MHGSLCQASLEEEDLQENQQHNPRMPNIPNQDTMETKEADVHPMPNSTPDRAIMDTTHFIQERVTANIPIAQNNEMEHDRFTLPGATKTIPPSHPNAH